MPEVQKNKTFESGFLRIIKVSIKLIFYFFKILTNKKRKDEKIWPKKEDIKRKKQLQK